MFRLRRLSGDDNIKVRISYCIFGCIELSGVKAPGDFLYLDD